MEPKTKFNLVSLIVVIVVLIFLVLSMTAKKHYSEKNIQNLLTPECSAGEKKQCISDEGYQGYMACENGFYSEKCFIASLDDCRVAKNQLQAVCCKGKTGLIYDCSEKTEFRAGDYVIVKTNLQKALQGSNVNLDSYKACTFTKLLVTGSEVPSHYVPGTAFYSQDVGCSTEFNANNFHQAAVSGFVPEGNGKILLSEVRIYPAATVLQTGQDALDNIPASTSVFRFEVNVIG